MAFSGIIFAGVVSVVFNKLKCFSLTVAWPESAPGGAGSTRRHHPQTDRFDSWGRPEWHPSCVTGPACTGKKTQSFKLCLWHGHGNDYLILVSCSAVSMILLFFFEKNRKLVCWWQHGCLMQHFVVLDLCWQDVHSSPHADVPAEITDACAVHVSACVRERIS